MEAPTKRPRRGSGAALAASKLQQAWRRFARRRFDVVTGEPVRGDDCFELVEPNGSVYAFSARALAQLFVCTARFVHPATRRELHAAEVARLRRRLSPGAAGLLELTLRYGNEARRALEAQGSVAEHLATEAGLRLDHALEAAEFGDVEATMDRCECYANAVVTAARHDGGAARKLSALHRELCERRRELCVPACYFVVTELLDALEDASKRWPSKRLANTALETWFSERSTGSSC